ncbi:MAG TPA: OmpH family outer membrane protein [Halioglobus sp.]
MSRLLKVALAILAFSVPTLGWTEGKIAVVDVQGAILQTDVAQKRLGEIRSQDEYKKNKAEYDRLKTEGEALLKTFQKDAAVMSQDQKANAQKKLSSMQDDLEHVTSKLQQAEQTAGQALLQEMAPKVQDVLREIIEKDGIGLLLQRNAVVHAEASYSITAQVTDKLNQLNAK